MLIRLFNAQTLRRQYAKSIFLQLFYDIAYLLLHFPPAVTDGGWRIRTGAGGPFFQKVIIGHDARTDAADFRKALTRPKAQYKLV